jgi:hypothetical protein
MPSHASQRGGLARLLNTVQVATPLQAEMPISHSIGYYDTIDTMCTELHLW